MDLEIVSGTFADACVILFRKISLRTLSRVEEIAVVHDHR